MKKDFFLIIIMFSLNIYSQKMDKYDLLINEIKLKEQSESMVNQMIDTYKKQRPDIPLYVWQELKKQKLNGDYIIAVKNIFKENYTSKEVDNLITTIDKYGINAYTPKPEITQKMYDVGKQFGKNLGNQILIKLKSLGY